MPYTLSTFPFRLSSLSLGPPPVFPIDIGPEKARGRAFTHPEQGSCSPLVNRRASLSSLAYLKLPAIPLRNLSYHSLARILPARFSVREGPSPRFGSSPPPWWGPGSQGDSRRRHRPGYFLESRVPLSSAGGGGVFLPASSTEKSAPHAAKRSGLAPGPWQSRIKKTRGGQVFLSG